jgi:hypothetical protein
MDLFRYINRFYLNAHVNISFLVKYFIMFPIAPSALWSARLRQRRSKHHNTTTRTAAHNDNDCVSCKLVVDMQLLARKSQKLHRFIRRHMRDLFARGIFLLADVVVNGKLDWNKIPILREFLRRASMQLDEQCRELHDMHVDLERSDEYVTLYHRAHHNGSDTHVMIVPPIENVVELGQFLWHLHETLLALCTDTVETMKILDRLMHDKNNTPTTTKMPAWPHFGNPPNNAQHVNTAQVGLVYPVRMDEYTKECTGERTPRYSLMHSWRTPFAYMRSGLVTHATLHYFLARIKEAFMFMASQKDSTNFTRGKNETQ